MSWPTKVLSLSLCTNFAIWLPRWSPLRLHKLLDPRHGQNGMKQRPSFALQMEGLTVAEDLWEKGVLTMKDEDRRLVDFQRSDIRQVLQEVLTQAEGKKNEYLRKRWKIKKANGDVIILRDVFKIITWVNNCNR